MKKMFKSLFHFHKWVYIEKEEVYSFEGVALTKDVPTGYRKCDKCEVMQQYFFDSQGGCWFKILPQEANVVHRKIGIGEFYLDIK